jgi:hypothetical protein
MTARLDRFQRGLFGALQGVADVVTWAYAGQPMRDGSLLSLTIEAAGTTELGREALRPIATATLQVGAVTAGGVALARVNGMTVRYDIVAGDTVTTTRDALRLAIASLDPGRISAVASGTDKVVVTPAVPGGLWGLAVGGVVSEVSRDLDGVAFELVRTRGLYSLTFEAFSRQAEPRAGALAIMSSVLDRMRSRVVADVMATWGVRRWVMGELIDISAIAGAHWSTRVRLPVEFAMRSVSVEPVEEITTVGVDVAATAAI